LYDAKWQNPFHSARKLTPILEGKHKPIYSPNNDCGDHVVVINSRHLALLGREWKLRVYFHHPGYNKVDFNTKYIQYLVYATTYLYTCFIRVILVEGPSGYPLGNYTPEILLWSCGRLATTI
jgi:hypothetical protein